MVVGPKEVCMPEVVHNQAVTAPDGRKVGVLFYDDGSIRFRIHMTPIVIEEAFLPGNRQGHALIKVAPKRD
jgi:hypothetical protein